MKDFSLWSLPHCLIAIVRSDMIGAIAGDTTPDMCCNDVFCFQPTAC